MTKKPSIDFPKKMETLDLEKLSRLIDICIEEDLGERGDITSDSLLAGLNSSVDAKIIAKEDGVVCGVDIIPEVYRRIDPNLHITRLKKDGDTVKNREPIARLSGSPQSITKGERIALNFFGLLSGVASKVNRYQSLIRHTQTRLLDTRKTLPALREFQKYAVRCGGGYNHRIGLYDMILIKDNHIAAVGSVRKAVELARVSYPNIVVEIEVASQEQVMEALSSSADILMLDNMDNQAVKEALQLIGNQKYVEVSGNVNETRLLELAEMGVDFVSMGELTHTVKPLDISLLIE